MIYGSIPIFGMSVNPGIDVLTELKTQAQNHEWRRQRFIRSDLRCLSKQCRSILIVNMNTALRTSTLELLCGSVVILA